jgi:hypothetical protein
MKSKLISPVVIVQSIHKRIKKEKKGGPKTSPWFGRIINKSNQERLARVIEDGKDYLVHGGGCDAADK